MYEDVIKNNAKLAYLVFENKPQYFEYIRQKFGVHEDDILLTHHKFWRPDLNWNQINMVLDAIADIDEVKRIELEYNYKRFLINFVHNDLILKDYKMEGRNKFILNVWDGCLEFYDKFFNFVK